MRPLLSVAVSAVLWSTAAAVAAEPAAPDKARPAEARAAADAPAIPAGWSLMTSEEDGFRAAFPSKPEVDNRTVDTEEGRMRVNIYGISGSKGGASYLSVSVAHYPYGTTDPAVAEAVMNSSRDALLNEQNYKLVSEKQVRVAGSKGDKSTFLGHDYEAIGPRGQHLSLRLVLVNDKLYQLMFLRTTKANEPFKQLVSSFSLR